MKKRLHPYMIIIISFVSVITLGTILLSMPFATKTGSPLKFVDSLFMATSAVCVTGLGTVNILETMSIFGMVVMAVLMEIGGLSFITIAVFFYTILGAKIGFSNKFLLRESLNQSSIRGIITLVRRIIITSAIIQFIGTMINLIPLMDIYGDFWKAFGVSSFHSVAAFNNAGFDIFGSESMIPYADNIILNATTMFMIVMGSMGFIVIDEIIKKRRFKTLSLHSKLAVATTFFLIVIGTLLIKLTCRTVYAPSSMLHETEGMTWLQAMFTAITCRTAGFTTYDMALLERFPATYIICIILMFIGASPCSTGGGVKTTTIAVVALVIYYFAIGKKTRAFKRKISDGIIMKAFVLVTVGVLIVFNGTLVLSAVQPEFGFQKSFFEVVSAFSTTGLSMGITSSLNTFNKVLLCLIMLCGRLGPLTVIGVVNKNWMSTSNEKIQYIEENVIIG